MKYSYTIILIATFFCLKAQKYEYQVSLESFEITGLGGMQSYSHAQYQGEWLIVGGRLDGLHQRQPFAAFDVSGNNTNIYVVNPETKDVWKAPFDHLPSNLKEQLASTNMQFYQLDDKLILTGGYAYSSAVDDHITFPFITVINIEELIKDVKAGFIEPSNFLQLEDEKFAVTGGVLSKIDDVFKLIGGHRFDGRYNPMGPTHGPGFFQEYTDEIRNFTMNVDDNILSIEHISTNHDERHFHRRDYNVLSQYNNGEEELMVFSGVFQPTADIPWLYPITLTKSSYEPREDFIQRYNHYHCAAVPIYNETENEMHNIFFGGIAQFYLDNGIVVQDNDIPFVNTIADVSRSNNGILAESVLDNIMPGYLGTGSHFLYNDESIFYDKEVLNGDLINETPILIGYIYGGIRSSLPNIFFINDGSQSDASNTLFKVYLSKKIATKVEELSSIDNSLLIYPNPASNIVRMKVELDKPTDLEIGMYHLNGMLIGTQSISKNQTTAGSNYIALDKMDVLYGAYLYKIKVDGKSYTRKVIWTE